MANLSLGLWTRTCLGVYLSIDLGLHGLIFGQKNGVLVEHGLMTIWSLPLGKETYDKKNTT